jgi:hypothetical protein
MMCNISLQILCQKELKIATPLLPLFGEYVHTHPLGLVGIPKHTDESFANDTDMPPAPTPHHFYIPTPH